MKIDWTKAPSWAQWLAVDYDGEAYWFENGPVYNLFREMWDLDNGDIEFAFSMEAPEIPVTELYERPKKAELEIDWTKAPEWAQWLAVDNSGSAYWYRHCPTEHNEFVWQYPFGSHQNYAFAFHTEEPEDFTQSLYKRPKKAELEIDWASAPNWAQWLAVDQAGSAYWYRDYPKTQNKYIWEIPEKPNSFEFAFYTAEPEDFTQALYERPSTSTNEETTMTYTVKPISAVRIQPDLNEPPVEIAEGQWRDARDLVSLCDPDKGAWPKIKMIKIFRTMHHDIGLRDAKAVVEAAWQERHSYY